MQTDETNCPHPDPDPVLERMSQQQVSLADVEAACEAVLLELRDRGMTPVSVVFAVRARIAARAGVLP